MKNANTKREWQLPNLIDLNAILSLTEGGSNPAPVEGVYTINCTQTGYTVRAAPSTSGSGTVPVGCATAPGP